jgi:rod shape-determining protein MreD
VIRNSWVRIGLVVIAVVVIQVGAVAHLRLGGVHPEMVWLLPLAAGLIGGTEFGAVVGFSSGLLLDCLLPTPFGLTALVGVLLGFVAGVLSERGVLSGIGAVWWMTPLMGAGAGLIGVMAYGVVGYLLGQDQFVHVDYLVLLPVVAIFDALVAIPVTLAVAWSVGEVGPRHRQRRASW